MANNKNYSKRAPHSKRGKGNAKQATKRACDKDSVLMNGLDKYSRNDPDWYIYDPVMFDGVIAMPTFEIKGDQSIPVETYDVKGPWALETPSYKLPNVLAYAMNPAAGWSPTAQSPINLMARKMYAELSASNAKTSNYAPEDVAICILALGQILAMIENLKRMYGIVNHFNFFNRSIPKELINTQLFNSSLNYDRLRTNLSDFRSGINQLISRVDTIQFPSEINYFKQCTHIYRNVFEDRDDKMPTYHFMYPHSTWILDEASSDRGSMLKEYSITADAVTYVDLIDNVNAMIDAVMTSSTFNYIFSDVVNLINRNVFSNATISVEMLPIDYSVVALYSEEFNWQVMNMSILGTPEKPDNWTFDDNDYTYGNNVYADANAAMIWYQPGFTVAEALADLPIPIRIPDINISDRDLISCLAYYTPWIVNKRVDTWYKEATALSTFYCVGVAIARGTNDGQGELTFIQNNYLPLTQWTGNQLLDYVTEPIHTPYFGGSVATSTGTRKIFPISKIGTFTQIQTHPMDNLRYQAILGLFKYR